MQRRRRPPLAQRLPAHDLDITGKEIDPATGGVQILKYVVVHDCGRELNPLIAEGMVL
jgi:xanthine dehydrogenase molybdopterin-binding subunit B